VGDVEAHEVHQAERAEAESGRVDQDAVDGGEIGDALREDAQRLRDVGPAGVVDDESRRVLAANRRVAEAPRERGERLGHRRIRQLSGDHLDDLHHRHRVEEVVARDALRPLAGCGHGSHGERRGVRGEHGVGADDALEPREERALRGEILDDRFDHQLARRERLEVIDDLDAAQRGVDGPALELAALRELAEGLADRIPGLAGGARLGVENERARAALG
jgi:hypothetical protein